MKILDADTYVRRLLDSNGLSDWAVVWGDDRDNAGTCEYTTRTIHLSRPIIAILPEAHRPLFEELAVHEVAHAKTPGDGHGFLWKMWVLLLGGMAREHIPILLDKGDDTVVG